jgi:hypothetical protein
LPADPEAIGVSGIIFTNNSVLLEPCYRFADSTVDGTPGDTGNYSIVLLDGQSNVLQRVGFNMSFSMSVDYLGTTNPECAPFAFRVPYNPQTKSIQIRNVIDDVLVTRQVSPNTPTANVTFPNGGEVLTAGTNQTISWQASDSDGDELAYIIAYSQDGGGTWTPIALDLNETSYVWDTSGLETGSNYLVKVIATDGINTAEDASNSTFTISAGGRNLAVTDVSPSKTAVGQGFSLNLSVTVTNLGNYTETSNVTAYYGNGTLAPEQWDVFWSMGDCNKDGCINGTDAEIIVANFGWTGPPGGNPADINSDGKVDMYDAMTCANNQGRKIWTYFLSGDAIGTQAVINLPPGNFASLNFTWNTTGLGEYQNFTVSAYAWPVPNEVYVADNSLGDGNVTIVHAGDINGDGKIDVKDVAKVCSLFGVKYADPRYEPNCDLTGPTQGLADGKIDARDVALAASRYGWRK